MTWQQGDKPYLVERLHYHYNLHKWMETARSLKHDFRSLEQIRAFIDISQRRSSCVPKQKRLLSTFKTSLNPEATPVKFVLPLKKTVARCFGSNPNLSNTFYYSRHWVSVGRSQQSDTPNLSNPRLCVCESLSDRCLQIASSISRYFGRKIHHLFHNPFIRSPSSTLIVNCTNEGIVLAWLHRVL